MIFSILQLNNASDNVAYVWCPQENQLKFLEFIYLSSAILLSLILVVIFNSVLFTNIEDLFEYHPIVCLGFLTMWIVNHSIDIHHLTTKSLTVSNEARISKITIEVAIESVVGLIFGFGVYRFKAQKEKHKRVWFIIYGMIFSTAGTSLILYSPPQIFFVSVYPVEILSTWGFILVCVASFFVWPFTIKQFCCQNKIHGAKYEYCAQGIFYILSYTLLIFLTYSFILLYLTAMNSLKRSPGSQLLQGMFALFPPIVATLLGFVLPFVDRKLKIILK